MQIKLITDRKPLIEKHTMGWRCVAQAKTLDEFREMISEYWENDFDDETEVDVRKIFPKTPKWGTKLIDVLCEMNFEDFMYKNNNQFYKSAWK